MVAVFTQCGIGEITRAEPSQAGTVHSSYRLADKNGGDAIVVWITNTTKTLEAVSFREQDLYINGEVLGTMPASPAPEENRAEMPDVYNVI